MTGAILSSKWLASLKETEETCKELLNVVQAVQIYGTCINTCTLCICTYCWQISRQQIILRYMCEIRLLAVVNDIFLSKYSHNFYDFTNVSMVQRTLEDIGFFSEMLVQENLEQFDSIMSQCLMCIIKNFIDVSFRL